MATVRSFEELEIWKMARIQAAEIYNLSKGGNFSKDFSLKNQINASAGSCMDNIAEGFERYSAREFTQFLIVAKGSNGEIQSQLYRAFDREYITPEIFTLRQNFSKTLGKKIYTFINYLKKTNFKTKPPPK